MKRKATKVNRTEFEQFRDAPNKRITADISMTRKPNQRSFLYAVGVMIYNDLDIDAKLEINYNPDSGTKAVSVIVEEAGGPICRLCVDGLEHKPYGRCHRHSLLYDDCPKGRLHRDIVAVPHLENSDLHTVLRYFFRSARIQFSGKLYPASLRRHSLP